MDVGEADWFDERFCCPSATSWDTDVELMTSRGLEGLEGLEVLNQTCINACILERAVQHWRASWWKTQAHSDPCW